MTSIPNHKQDITHKSFIPRRSTKSPINVTKIHRRRHSSSLVRQLISIVFQREKAQP